MKERTGTELVDRVESVVDPEAVEVVVAYLPYQELETSEGFFPPSNLIDSLYLYFTFKKQSTQNIEVLFPLRIWAFYSLPRQP